MSKPTVLTIAGFDPTGGAGVLADCKTAELHEARATAAITALTVQDGKSIESVTPVDLEILERTLRSLLDTEPIAVIKTGLLPNASIVDLLARILPAGLPLILDPVLASSSGFPFLDLAGQRALLERLLPKATLVTPNLLEAETLTGEKDPTRAAAALRKRGAKAVLIKGGHGSGPEAIDLLFDDTGVTEFRLPRYEGQSFHGSGCALSAAIAAEIAKGTSLHEAIEIAKDSLHRRMKTAIPIGEGRATLE